MSEDHSVIQAFSRVEVLQHIAKFLAIKDLSAFKEVNEVTREAADWELSLRTNRSITIYLGQYGPFPNLNNADSVKLIVSEVSLNETHIPFITETIQACRKAKKLILAFPFKYADMDDSMITYFKHLKLPLELEIAEKELCRMKSCGIKLKSCQSLVLTYNRMMHLVDPSTENPDDWSLNVIKSIVSLKDLRQFTATANVTEGMFLRPKPKCFPHVTDLTLDDFRAPLTKINKKSFPALKSLTLIDPETREYPPEGPNSVFPFFSGFSPCPLSNLTVKYYKSTHTLDYLPDLKYIFPRLKQITVTGVYIPCGVFQLIQNNLCITRLRLLGSLLFGTLTSIIVGYGAYLGVQDMAGLKYLDVGVKSYMKENPQRISDALADVKGLQEVQLHLSQLSDCLIQQLDKRFKCVKLDSWV